MKKSARAAAAPVDAPAPLAGTDRPSAAEVDQALLAAWQRADAGDLAEGARQARLAVTAALVAGAPALSEAQRAMLDLLEGSVLLLRGEHAPGLARLGPALGWFSPPESLSLLEAGVPARRLAAFPARTTPAWACAALGQALGRMGDPARGLAWVVFASALAGQQGLAPARLQALGVQGELLALLDQHLPAIEVLQKAVSLATKTAPRQVQAGLLNQLAATWLARAHERLSRGQPAIAQEAAVQAQACAGRALQAALTGQVAPARAAALCHRAEAALLLAQAGPAEADLAAAVADPGRGHATGVDLLRVQAALRSHQGLADAAQALLDQAWDLSQDEPDLALRARVLAAQQGLAARQGSAEGRAWWAGQAQALASLRLQRRLQAAHQCARLLGAADLAASGLPLDR